jgi:hypothetical protein
MTTLHRDNKLLNALRIKYRTPREALRALGLDENLAEGKEKLSAEALSKICDYMSELGMPAEELETLRQMLSKYSDADQRAGTDEEEEEEESKPTSGGMRLRPGEKEQLAIDQRTRARIEREVRDRRAMASDSAGAKSFAERYPETLHIRHG